MTMTVSQSEDSTAKKGVKSAIDLTQLFSTNTQNRSPHNKSSPILLRKSLCRVDHRHLVALPMSIQCQSYRAQQQGMLRCSQILKDSECILLSHIAPSALDSNTRSRASS